MAAAAAVAAAPLAAALVRGGGGTVRSHHSVLKLFWRGVAGRWVTVTTCAGVGAVAGAVVFFRMGGGGGGGGAGGGIFLTLVVPGLGAAGRGFPRTASVILMYSLTRGTAASVLLGWTCRPVSSSVGTNA